MGGMAGIRLMEELGLSGARLREWASETGSGERSGERGVVDGVGGCCRGKLRFAVGLW